MRAPARRIAFLALLAAGAGPASAATLRLTIEDLAFDPAKIDARVGDMIVWINKDAFDHTATVKGGWDVTIPAGGEARLRLEAAGSFDYYCRLHPNMQGRVVVAPR